MHRLVAVLSLLGLLLPGCDEGTPGHLDLGPDRAPAESGPDAPAPDLALDQGRKDREQADRAASPDRSKVDLARTDLAKADLAKTDLTKTDLAKTDLTKIDLAKPDLAKLDLFKPDLPTADLAKTDLAKLDLGKPDAMVPGWSVPARVDTSASKEQELQLALDGGGNLYAGWIEVNSITTQVRVARRDAGAASFGQPLPIDVSANREQDLRLVADGQGNLYAGWIEVNSITTDVKVARRDAGTGSWGQPVRIDVSASAEQELRLTVDGQGNLYAGWIEVNSITTEVKVARRAVASGSFGQPVRVDVSSSDEKELRLAADGQGNLYAGWIEVNSITTEVKVARRAVASGSFGQPLRIDVTANDEQELVLAADGQGNLYAGWIEVNSITTEVRVARREVTTGSWSSPSRLDLSASKERELALAVDSLGNAQAAWIQADSISTEVRLARREAGTGSWSSPVRLDLSASQERELALAVDGQNNVQAGWIQADSISTEVRVARREASSGSWGQPKRLDISASKEIELRLVSGQSTTHAGWIQLSSITTDVLVATFPFP